MRVLIVLLVIVILVVVGMKVAGLPVPLLDYAVGPFGEGRGPGMPDIVIEAPGFDDAHQLP